VEMRDEKMTKLVEDNIYALVVVNQILGGKY
jgi:hypothetical protein